MAHNNKHIVFNPHDPYRANSFVYINYMRNAADPQEYSPGGTKYYFADEVNSDGYMLEVNGTTQRITFLIGLPAGYTGNWIFRWTGTGTFSFPGAGTPVSGSLSGTNGECILPLSQTAENNILWGNTVRQQFRITDSDVADPVRDLILIRADQETNWDNGEIFNPDYIEHCKCAGVIRMLDLEFCNVSLMALAQHEVPTTYFSTRVPVYLTNEPIGTTTKSGNAYTLSGLTSSPTHGQMAHVTWNAAATDTFTLNGKTVALYNGGTISASTNSGKLPTGNNVRKSVVVYHEDLDKWLMYGGWSDANPRAGIVSEYGTIPFAHQVQLCNLTGAHPWFNIPLYACTVTSGVTDLVVDRVTYALANLDTGLIPHWEFSNEFFNGGFPGNGLAQAISIANGYGDRWIAAGALKSRVASYIQGRYDAAGKTCYHMAMGQLGENETNYVIELNTTAHGFDSFGTYATHYGCSDYWATRAKFSLLGSRTKAEFIEAAQYMRDVTHGSAGEKEAALQWAWDNTYIALGVTTLTNALTDYQTVVGAATGVPTFACYEGGYGRDWPKNTTTLGVDFNFYFEINDVSLANPCVLTFDDGHFFKVGDIVRIYNFTNSGGQHELSNSANYTGPYGYSVTDITDTTVTLDLDASAFSAITFGLNTGVYGSTTSGAAGCVWKGDASYNDSFGSSQFYKLFFEEMMKHPRAARAQQEICRAQELLGITYQALFNGTGVGAWSHRLDVESPKYYNFVGYEKWQTRKQGKSGTLNLLEVTTA